MEKDILTSEQIIKLNSKLENIVSFDNLVNDGFISLNNWSNIEVSRRHGFVFKTNNFTLNVYFKNESIIVEEDIWFGFAVRRTQIPNPVYDFHLASINGGEVKFDHTVVDTYLMDIIRAVPAEMKRRSIEYQDFSKKQKRILVDKILS